MLSGKVFLPSTKRSRDVDGTLAFQVPDHLGHRILRWNGNQHVDMVNQQLPFQNFAFFVRG
jgi:hypothetical protein